MNVPLSDLIGWRDKLLAGRFNGVRSFRDQNGESVEYRSDAELAAALADVERRIASVGAAHAKTIVFRTSKGL